MINRISANNLSIVKPIICEMDADSKRKFQLAIGFTVFILAVAVSYFSVTEVENPQRDIYLVIDISGSMADQSKITFAKNAATEFVNAFQLDQSSGYRIGLIAFEAQVHTLSNLTNDPTGLKDAISKLQPGGDTAMGDAITTANNLFSQETGSDSAKTVLLLTDGISNRGMHPITAAQNAKASGLTIFTVGYGNDADVSTLNQVATMTGGKFYKALSGQDLVSTFANIADVMISPVAHYGSRTLILVAIPILLFIPVIERGVATMIQKAEETFLDKRGTPRPTCPNCGTLNRKTSKFCQKCGNSLKGRI